MADCTLLGESEPNGYLHGFRYTCHDWGDLIEGTKAQIQALGIGGGLAFPGEKGAPRRELMTRDMRGNPATVSRGWCADFMACLTFAGWPPMPQPWDEWSMLAPGLLKARDTSSDRYEGSAAALVAAGIVDANHLPGMPGMRKTRVRILADGSVPNLPPNTVDPRTREPGSRVVDRIRKDAYRVRVVLAEDEHERRRLAFEQRLAAWRDHVRRLPRPERLRPGRHGHLRLVYSAAR